MKIDWKQKLSSRKFWTMFVAFITSVLTALNVAQTEITAVASIIGGLGVMAVYILAEAKTDSSPRVEKPPDSL